MLKSALFVLMGLFTSTSFGQGTAPSKLAQSETVASKGPGHQVLTSTENSQEALLEAEVSRTERAERMKKILQEVRKDLQSRGAKAKEEKVD